MRGKKPVDIRPAIRLGSTVVATMETKEEYCVVMHRRKIQGTRFATLYPLVPVMLEVAKVMNVT